MTKYSKTNNDIHTGIIVLNDGTVFTGQGFGAETEAVGEICFNTSMTGYQESLSDLSFAGQIITFTFPHIGNVGTNDEDTESNVPACRGLITREFPTNPSNHRSTGTLIDWCAQHNLVGVSGVDTRALTKHIRDKGAPNGVIAYNKFGDFDVEALINKAREWAGLDGMDLAIEVATKKSYDWDQNVWGKEKPADYDSRPHVVAIDYGAKKNILRCLVEEGFESLLCRQK